MSTVRVAGVIGAGVMGSAIAAHLAGAGVRVHLLDIVPRGADIPDRDAVARTGLRRALGAKPAAFFDEDAAKLIRIGNLEDHADRLGNCDLVIEAVVENLDIKRKVFAAISEHLGPECVLASNTSGLSVQSMNESLPVELRSRFVVLHFFNPVRYMRLLEVVGGPDTDPSVIEQMVAFGEWLGKGVVFGKDTTNFVANRIGIHSMMLAMSEMSERGLDIETVDAIAGKPLGRPKSGIFQLGDIVGIDTLMHVANNCYDTLQSDPERERFKMPAFVSDLVAKGRLGRKSGEGFYKKAGKDVLVLDLQSGDYRPQHKVAIESLAQAKGSPAARITKLCAADDVGGNFAWAITSRTLLYAANLVGEIADDIVNIDRAMRWGFNWDLGPFEIWDALGVKATAERMKADGLTVPAWVEQMLQAGRESFYAGGASQPSFYDKASQSTRSVPVHPKSLSIAALKEVSGNVVEENAGVSLVDLGDGVLGLEVHTKMNTLDGDVIAMFDRAVEIAEDQFQAIVVGNDADHFSAGANIQMIVGAALKQDWAEIDRIIAGLQDGLQRLRYCRVPVVSAPCQYTLGGGAELAMASDASQAYAECYMGLVEVGIGLLPAGCGCLHMVERFTEGLRGVDGADPLPLIGQASLNIAMARASSSAEEARKLRYLRPSDGISLNRDFLLFEAKQRALGLANAGYRPPRSPTLKAAGYDASKTIGVKIWGMVEGGWASKHDALVASKVAHVLCGGTVAAGEELSEQHYLDLEREAFLQLCGEKKTQERIEHMLKTGKPLRN